MIGRYSEDGLRRALHRLSRQGVVRAIGVGNAFAYRFNGRHLAGEAIRQLAQMRSTLLARLTERFAGWEPAPTYAAVFGSLARGTSHGDSDIDLLLVTETRMRDSRWEAQLNGLAFDVTDWTGNDLRVLEYTEEEVRASARREPVLLDVADHGMTVAGTRAWFATALGAEVA